MSIATAMNGPPGPSSPLSPVSPRTAKAGLFRARSPPVEQTYHTQPAFDLTARIDPFAGRYTPESSSDGHSLALPKGGRSVEGGYASSAGASLGHTPPLPHFIRQQQTQPPSPPSTEATSPRDLLGNLPGTMRAPGGRGSSSGHGRDDESDEEPRSTDVGRGMTGGSDEMLMTLLAGQAAVDCEQLPIGGWEEVDSWKKELTLLSTRLESLIARHQRETKILTAARTLQKLNTANKRMSKQTMESLEQSEKRTEAAEKEVLLLRDREANLRRRLMEHWSGVMAWEVRRLERTSSETYSRLERANKRAATSKAREEDMSRKVQDLEAELSRRAERTTELEEMVVEMGRRERAIEEEVRELDVVKKRLQDENAAKDREIEQVRSGQGSREEDMRSFEQERQNWLAEKRMLIQDREAVVRARAADRANGQMSEKDREMVERVRLGLAGLLGRKAVVGDAELPDAVEEVKKVLSARENEVVRLKEELREVNVGLEEEIRRISADRDLWKGKAEDVQRSGSSRENDVAALEKKLRSQGEQLSDLTLRNESLSTSLQAAQAAASQQSSSNKSIQSLENQIRALTTELDSIAGQFNEVWRILPPTSRRKQAELVDPHTGMSNSSLVSPSRAVNFAALQQLYTPHEESFSGIDEMLNRVRCMVDDGRLLVERVCRLGQERELLKQNAARAKKLAEDSRISLETYQRQVAVLEDRLAKSGASESKFLEELNSLRSSLDAANASKRQLEISALQAKETCDRLTSANDVLSAKALTLADEAEQERRSLAKKWQEEIDSLKQKLDHAQEEVDEAKHRGQAQRIQLLDELNSLQAENGDLRKQVRAAKK